MWNYNNKITSLPRRVARLGVCICGEKVEKMRRKHTRQSMHEDWNICRGCYWNHTNRTLGTTRWVDVFALYSLHESQFRYPFIALCVNTGGVQVPGICICWCKHEGPARRTMGDVDSFSRAASTITQRLLRRRARFWGICKAPPIKPDEERRSWGEEGGKLWVRKWNKRKERWNRSNERG